MPRVLTCARISAVAFALLVPLAADASAAPGPAHPASCKPLSPVAVELRLLDHAPGQPAHVEARITALRPVEDLHLEVSLSGGAQWAGGQRNLAGPMAAGARRAVPMGVSLPARGHSEVFVKVTFRLASGSALSSGAYLAFDDGQPARPAVGHESRWDGNAVMEFPAAGVNR
ncbi:MAG TPA: hypothetical protein VMS93_08710 [Candidatus Saccharimonadales bacterium]|nr:hypothetical protein [Candidatus Saccharimonadales bacterium]